MGSRKYFLLGHLGALTFVIPSLVYAETAPEFLGLSLPEAQELAKTAGIVLEIVPASSPRPRQQVLLQDPLPGEVMVDKVSVVVSDGIDTPNLTNAPLTDAIALLGEVGISWEVVHRLHSGVAAGTIVSQVPRPGERLDPGRDVIFLDVAEEHLVAIPSLVGNYSGNGYSILRALGFNVESWTVETVQHEKPYPTWHCQNEIGTIVAVDPDVPKLQHGFTVRLGVRIDRGWEPCECVATTKKECP